MQISPLHKGPAFQQQRVIDYKHHVQKINEILSKKIHSPRSHSKRKKQKHREPSKREKAIIAENELLFQRLVNISSRKITEPEKSSPESQALIKYKQRDRLRKNEQLKQQNLNIVMRLARCITQKGPMHRQLQEHERKLENMRLKLDASSSSQATSRMTGVKLPKIKSSELLK